MLSTYAEIIASFYGYLTYLSYWIGLLAYFLLFCYFYLIDPIVYLSYFVYY